MKLYHSLKKGIKMANIRYWSAEEDAYIIENYKNIRYCDIAAHLGRKAHSVQQRVCKLIKKGVITEHKVDTRKGATNMCFDCKRAAGKNMCSWARSLTPVKGWEAERAIVDAGRTGEFETWHILSCPLFDAEEKRRRKKEPEEVETKKKQKNRKRIEITLSKDENTIVFSTMQKCSEFLAKEQNMKKSHVEWLLKKRKKIVYGYTAHYKKIQ